MSTLDADQRNALPADAFALPDERKYPIEDVAHARDALARAAQNETGSTLQKIRDAVYRKFPALKPKTAEKAEQPSSVENPIVVATDAPVELAVPMWKNEDQQLIYGVVLTPGVEDSQGDVISAEEIQQAAHRFLVEYRKHDVQHDGHAAPVETVESFIAPTDMTIAGEHVLKGAWVLAAKVNDPATWERVRKEELTGWSIGGSGVREPIPVQ